MNITVCKFGGSSAAGPDGIRQILKIILADPSRRYIILSAPGANAEYPEKVTDRLSCLWRARHCGTEAGALIAEIAARYKSLCNKLGIPDLSPFVKTELRHAVEISEAHTLSRGEYLMAMLFSSFSGIPMCDSSGLIWFNADGKLNYTRTCMAFREMSRRHFRAVIPGFYGSGPDGEIRTFPRNGSDITGAMAAVGLGASVYENWTDVPGLMTGDPAKDETARVIPHIGFDEMLDMARSGARVLHPDCIEPLKDAGIPIHLMCTMRPGLPGTWISG